MLHCNMTHLSDGLRLGLEDLLADLWHARRVGDLGRLALLSYSDVRRWAQAAGRQALAGRARAVVLECPHESRASFLTQVDSIIAEMEQVISGDDEARVEIVHRTIPSERHYFSQRRS